MDHLEAANLGATEKYLLGTLDDALRDAFEEHFFECLECADDLRAAAAVAAAVHAPAALVDPAPAGTGQVPVTALAAARGGWRRRFPRASSSVVAWTGLAASLCLAAYQGLVVIPGLRDQPGASLQTVPSHFLSQSRGEAARIPVGPGDRYVALTLSRSWDRPFASYRCELRDAGGRVLLAETLPSRSATDELEILLPVGRLAAGSYLLVVEGVDAAGGPPAPAARYAFDLDRSGG